MSRLRSLSRSLDRQLVATPLAFEGRHGLRRRREWTIGVAVGPTLDALQEPAAGCNPVVTKWSVTDVAAAFVADPFLLRRAGRWWLFFEVFEADRNLGEIACSVSDDGLHWEYLGVVLRRSWHLSYPLVFEHDGEVWMTPESAAIGEVQLLRAVRFPDRWELAATLLRGEPYRDPTPWRSADGWRMLVATRPRDSLRLFQAPELVGPWRESPVSPLVDGESAVARPAGRVIEVGGRWRYFLQDGTRDYGSGIEAFAAPTDPGGAWLTEPLGPSRVLAADTTWHRDGMHTIDAHETADGWFACVDGFGPSLPRRRVDAPRGGRTRVAGQAGTGAGT